MNMHIYIHFAYIYDIYHLTTAVIFPADFTKQFQYNTYKTYKTVKLNIENGY